MMPSVELVFVTRIFAIVLMFLSSAFENNSSIVSFSRHALMSSVWPTKAWYDDQTLLTPYVERINYIEAKQCGEDSACLVGRYLEGKKAEAKYTAVRAGIATVKYVTHSINAAGGQSAVVNGMFCFLAGVSSALVVRQFSMKRAKKQEQQHLMDSGDM